MDTRRVDLIGLPLYGGIPVCCGDASLVTPIHGDGTLWARAPTHDGVGIERARKIYEDRYLELPSGDRGRLVVLGTETGGRWAPEALTILRNLAEAKSRSSPELLRRSTQVVRLVPALDQNAVGRGSDGSRGDALAALFPAPHEARRPHPGPF